MTRDIQVVVQPSYVPERSSAEGKYYFFIYRVTIINLGLKTVRLQSRRWVIQDGQGRKETVHGPGVVGQQPTILPGESFEYSSACPLGTPTGSMRGAYFMVDEDGFDFEVSIPLFFLRLGTTATALSLVSEPALAPTPLIP